MRTCIKCSNVIENDDAKFCKKCGTPLTPVNKTVVNTSEADVSKTTDSSYDGGISLGTGIYQPTPDLRKKEEVGSFVQNHSKYHDSSSTYRRSEGNRNMAWAIKSCFKRYATFSGRASRSEYWYFALFNNMLIWIPIILAFVIDHDIISPILCVAALLYILAIIIPGLAVAVRRLHDIGKSGSYCFVSFIPYIGAFILLYFLCKPSEEGENMYGETF